MRCVTSAIQAIQIPASPRDDLANETNFSDADHTDLVVIPVQSYIQIGLIAFFLLCTTDRLL